jgi:hypothetical protein
VEAGGVEPETYDTKIQSYYSLEILILDLILDFPFLSFAEKKMSNDIVAEILRLCEPF